MGSNASLQLEPLETLASSTSVTPDDPLWNQLLSLKLPVSGSAAAQELSDASFAFCAEMVRNNGRSGNFQTLILRVVDQCELACRPRASVVHLQQACGCVFLLRLFLKHMIETLEPAELQPHLRLEGQPATPLAAPLVRALLTVLVQSELSADSYWLQVPTRAAPQPGSCRGVRASRRGLRPPWRRIQPHLRAYTFRTAPHASLTAHSRRRWSAWPR